ncbi:MAG: acetyl/propionyl/methylcrotonyl-CoA carboxylase subunit alpha [Cellvibrionales bacterium]|nr:acetyl/propionyl/methylcrotonyl-CoA carboxylase subunit alpha [Cellvibrionales bacterium]
MSGIKFKRVLIANRGEIACRVMRTARRLGIETVAVYSAADRDALHVRMADEAVYLGPAPSRDSYLRGEKVLDAARQTGAEAVHPGYGFLSENAEFSRACAEAGIVFIGPPAAAIEAMGSKSAAKQIMERAGVPLIPGYHGDGQDRAVLKKAADDMGYPVLLKAVAGGGGKGMRQVWQAGEFDAALDAARRESQASFGNADMLVEKYLTAPRHVEIQVFCDRLGHAVYLFERDCSVQRRHQKIIEEAPAPGMTDALRAAMGEAAVRAARAIDYEGAGTVEFLLDPDGAFYFMEMNTRLQVEHPVTEMISGQDLVAWQLAVAAGEALPLAQDELAINGHAFEARIYAEDPANDFLPATGTLAFLQPPAESEYVRVDTGVVQGDAVSVHYDPLIAKLIVWDKTRAGALQRLGRALREYRIGGMPTNIDFLHRLAGCAPFVAAELDTGFIDTHRELLFPAADGPGLAGAAVPLAGLYLLLARRRDGRLAAAHGDPYSPWNLRNGWRLNQPYRQDFALRLGDEDFALVAEQVGAGPADNETEYAVTVGDKSWRVRGALQGERLWGEVDGHRLQATVAAHGDGLRLFGAGGSVDFRLVPADLGDEAVEAGGGLSAPMNGTVVAHLVEPGQAVERGAVLLVMEAMKMEHSIRAPADGQVVAFHFQPGELVSGGDAVLEFLVAGVDGGGDEVGE